MQPILSVDLSTGEINPLVVPETWVREYVGGASLAARLLYAALTPELDPLSPRAPLLFLTGPLTGTSGPAVGRFVVTGKSPATGLWAESNCGGFWGPELRTAGYDGLWISGRAEQPVYLSIQDGQVALRPAAHLWGLETYATQEAILQELGKPGTRVAVIGPAGEARLPFASILTDHGRVAGRTGLGAVMGAKNLKAIAVQGSGRVPLADGEGYARARSLANKDLRSNAETEVARQLGTASVADYLDYLGEMPKKYFQRVEYGGAERISGAVIADTILAGVKACHACVIACGRVVRLEDGLKRKGMEYETLVSFGPNLLIDDVPAITRLGELCDRLGMDTISASNTIGLALRLYESGAIRPEDTGGLPLRWGDPALIEQLLTLVARREGFGAYLAEGARALGKRFRAEELAVQVNGLEVAYHDPRGSSGMALVYATSPRGACHNQSDYFLVDIGGGEESLGMRKYPRLAGNEKARNVAIHQDWRTLFNSLVMCVFANVHPDQVLVLLNSATGAAWTVEGMMQAGERGWNLKRLINHRLGLRRENDRLPKALLRPFEDATPGKGNFVPDLEAMLAAYYQARGWDPVTGFPTPAKMDELGLGWAAADLAALTPELQANRT